MDADRNEPASSPRRGRRAGDAGRTREAILDAARTRFATDGFDGTSMRSIARTAGVDPALVAHHFGSKRDVFLAAHRIPEDPELLIGEALSADEHLRGEVLARAFLHRFLDDPRSTGVSLIRSAAADDSVAELLRQTLSRAMISHARALAGDRDDAASRVALVSALLVGIVFHVRILHVDVLDDAEVDEIARRVAPAVQALLDSP